ncbi:hypothetical protein BD310DRAFT_453789 [Dichomitus squalens]|uniref:LysM domain-containing protein n=1 Tax=Dichomitus squalens TaxID=114155 RepID=A0A4Q9PVH5_9APHY|nr:hypothetical protein BD310DRAFT_453789 [Dichomitus squalens]
MFPRSIVAVIVVAAVCSSVDAQVSNCARNYTVVSGDTCDEIAGKENVSSFQLATVNKATINAGCTNLRAGEELCLGIVGQDCEVTHVVANGDTCESIAEAAGTTLDILLENNPNVNSECNNIHPGEVLCTAKDVIA